MRSADGWLDARWAAVPVSGVSIARFAVSGTVDVRQGPLGSMLWTVGAGQTRAGCGDGVGCAVVPDGMHRLAKS